MSIQLKARNATAEDLVKVLLDQKSAKLDVVTPARNIWARGGQLLVKGTDAVIDENGVTPVNGAYQPTDVFDDGLAAKLEIPRHYVRKLRNERPDILDVNVNGLLHGRARRAADGTKNEIYAPDDRSFLLRLFRGEDGEAGVARAMLSSKYGLSFDHLDMLTAVMKGIQDSGVNVITRVSDLSERRMHIRFDCPDVYALAPELLEGYKSPFDSGHLTRAGAFDALRQQYGAHHIFSEKDAPLVFMGFDFTNSETGGGKYRFSPVLEIVRCTNGLTFHRKGEGIERRHLGARLEDGVIQASAETVKAAGALVSSETRDAVVQWLDKSYLEKLVEGLTEKSRTPIETPSETVPVICQGFGFSPDEQKGILDAFIVSGQPTAGGLMQAVSAYAQSVEDPDRAYEIELRAVDALDAAARR